MREVKGRLPLTPKRSVKGSLSVGSSRALSENVFRVSAFRNSPTIYGKGIVGFLFGAYIRNKSLYILIGYIFFNLLANQAYGLEVGSNVYTMQLIEFSQAGGTASSANHNMDSLAIAGALVTLQDSSSTNFTFDAGQVALFMPKVPWKLMKVISDLRARTEVFGNAIAEATWQRDNDPYFYWSIDITPPELVGGFSISLDEQPDFIIDTTESHFQFPEDALASGKHIFYVLPYLSGNKWDEDSLIKFDLWIDVDYPVVNQLTPSPGELIADNLIAISCLLYDIDSGLDINLTGLSLNDSSVYFDYDSGKRILTFTPLAPLSEGKNTVLLKAYDLVGNYVANAWDFIVDTQPPSGNILINNGEEYSHSAYVFINIETKDEVSGVKNIYLSNDGVFDTELNQPYPYSPLIKNWLVSAPDVDGIKTVYAKFQDAIGNLSGTYKDEIQLKLLNPDTHIIYGPPSTTAETVADFKYEATKPGCKFSYKLDSLDWSGWISSNTAHFTDLSEGNHYFSVKSAYDLNGDGEISIDEEDATPSQWVWTVKPEERLEKKRKRILFWRR